MLIYVIILIVLCDPVPGPTNNPGVHHNRMSCHNRVSVLKFLLSRPVSRKSSLGTLVMAFFFLSIQLVSSAVTRVL